MSDPRDTNGPLDPARTPYHHIPRNTQLLQQTVEVLQNSTIAVETAKDPLSKFWGAYKKVASEHDDEMLERCNGNMDIVLIFAGLFSAINTAFIIATQPDPVNTTNTLLVQLIQITAYGPTSIQPAALSSFAGYPSNFWTQALAYVSLGFSLLAALGAVLGKQWLGYYKTKRFGRGSLADRCKQRHRKFRKLQAWQFENVLQSFPVLLQISVLLFGLSLGAAMWTQQPIISILIIVITAFGVLCHGFTIAVSLLSLDCPFQTPVSLAIRAVFDHFRPSAGSKDHDDESTASASITSAMQWILETSTNPDILRSVVELLPTIPEQPSINIMVLCEQVRDMFKACFDHRGVPILEDSALAYGKALVYFSTNYPDAKNMLHQSTRDWNIWERWRILYLPRVLEECRISYHRMVNTRNVTSKSQFQADTRTALRMAVAAGIDEFADPDDERLVQDGRFRLQSPPPDLFNWLTGCAKHFYAIKDIDAVGDALLLLIGNCQELLPLDQRSITPFLNSDKGQPRSRRMRQIALRAACRTIDYQNFAPCDDDFSHAVLKAICPTFRHDDTGELVMNAIHLLNLENWPEDSDLGCLSLPEIQLLILPILPAPIIDNPTMYSLWCRALIRRMSADQPYHFRHTAVRIIENVRQDLVTIAAAASEADVSLRDLVFSELSPALLTAMSPTSGAENNDIINPISFHYIRLISTLVKSTNWHAPLIADCHIEKCITLLGVRSSSPHLYLYLATIFLCIAPPGQTTSCCDAITNAQWWGLMNDVWNSVQFYNNYDLHDIEILAAAAEATEKHIPQDLSKVDLQSFEWTLSKAIDRLERLPHSLPDWNRTISTVIGLKDMVRKRHELGRVESPFSLQLVGFPGPTALSPPRHHSPRTRTLASKSSSESQGEPVSDDAASTSTTSKPRSRPFSLRRLRDSFFRPPSRQRSSVSDYSDTENTIPRHFTPYPEAEHITFEGDQHYPAHHTHLDDEDLAERREEYQSRSLVESGHGPHHSPTFSMVGSGYELPLPVDEHLVVSRKIVSRRQTL